MNFTSKELLQGNFKKNTEYMNCLQPVNTRAVLNCILKSEDVMEKTSGIYQKNIKISSSIC